MQIQISISTNSSQVAVYPLFVWYGRKTVDGALCRIINHTLKMSLSNTKEMYIWCQNDTSLSLTLKLPQKCKI